jgi:hypothetical protein
MKHTCHATGCEVAVSPSIFMCHEHWSRLPSHLRNGIINNYRRGQENDKKPSLSYVACAVRAQCYFAVLDGRITQADADDRIASMERAVLVRDGLIGSLLDAENRS